MDALADCVDVPGFDPHGHGYHWPTPLLWLNTVADAMIVVAYLLISAGLVYFARKRRDVPFNRMFIAFGGFILACAVTFAMDVWTTWNAHFWLAGWTKAFAACLSAGTAVVFMRSLPEALAIPSTQQLTHANALLIAEIAERERAEQRLRESEERFRVLTNLSADWYWEQDAQHRMTLISDNACRITKRPPGAALGKSRWESSLYMAPAAVWDEHKRTLAEQRAFGDFVVHLCDGEGGLRKVSLSGTPIRGPEGSFLGYRGIARDITERTAAEEALRDSEEKFRRLVENMRDIFWIYCVDRGCFDYLSPSFESTCGLSCEVVYRDPTAFRRSLLPQAPEDGAALCAQPYEPLDRDFRVQKPDGNVRWLRSRSTRMFDRHGEQLVCGITEDVTERRAQEERKMHDALRQRDALVREVHHRIKNTLQGVIGLMRRHASRAGTPVRVVEAAIAQVQSIAIVHGLQGRGYGRGVDLEETLQAIAGMLQGLAGVPVRLDVAARGAGAAHLQLAEGEAVAIALLLNEIISNAIKHACTQAPDVAVAMMVRGPPPRVRITVRNRGRLPEGFDLAAGRLVGTGLSLVQALMPADGIRVTCRQDGAFVEVVIDLHGAVLVSPELCAA